MNGQITVSTIRWIPISLEISLPCSSVVTIAIPGFTFVTVVVVLTGKGSRATELLIDGFFQVLLRANGFDCLVGGGKVSQDGYGVVMMGQRRDSGRVRWTR